MKKLSKKQRQERFNEEMKKLIKLDNLLQKMYSLSSELDKTRLELDYEIRKNSRPVPNSEFYEPY